MSDHSPTRILLGLLGSPIHHSASPAMHEAAAAATGLRCHYQLIDVPDADPSLLGHLLDAIRRIGFAGVNVTFPYKEAVLNALDAIDDSAARVGAVNTVVVEGQRLVGHNTDVTGFQRGMRRWLGTEIAGPVALVGAGGVGKAIGFALADLGIDEIRIVEPDASKAQSLAVALSTLTRAVVVGAAEEALVDASGLVNASPVGMLPSLESPVPVHLLHDRLWIADAVYSPLRTPLLVAAANAGARTMTGRELVIDQAGDAFRIFTGLEADRAVMAEAFDRSLARPNTALSTRQ